MEQRECSGQRRKCKHMTRAERVAPDSVAAGVAAFLNRPLDVARMAAVVDRSRYRNRAEPEPTPPRA